MSQTVQFFCQNEQINGKFFAGSESTEPRPTVILLPGFPGNEEDVLGLGESLAAHRLNSLTFNYRGTYQSEGVFTLRNSLEDVKAAFDFLNN